METSSTFNYFHEDQSIKLFRKPSRFFFSEAHHYFLTALEKAGEIERSNTFFKQLIDLKMVDLEHTSNFLCFFSSLRVHDCPWPSLLRGSLRASFSYYVLTFLIRKELAT